MDSVVYTAMATDADGDPLSYSLSGTDAARFTIDPTTGAVRFTALPDFENPDDNDGDNVYDIVVTASDGTNSAEQPVAITVTNINDNTPSFTSATSAGVAENQPVDSVVYTAMATDADGDPLSYSLSGTDAARFTIDPATGAVRFAASPDFENPGDAGGNNVYDIIVTATDGINETTRSVAITVTDENEVGNPPVFTSPATATVPENQTLAYTAVATDADGDPLSYSLSGTDAARFTIDATTGVVSFRQAPDFETPGDAGGNNVYDIIVTATDGINETTRSVAITVTDENEVGNPPVFTSPATATVPENQTLAYTAVATDADGDPLSYSLSGTDAARFTIDATTGVVSFRQAPDFETPGDAGGNNVYDIIVTATDGINETTRSVAITVTDENEVGNPPVFTSPATATVPENQTLAYTAVATDADGDPLSYSLSGTDAARFTIDPNTGAVRFIASPDFETPADAGGNNVYDIIVTATDGANDTPQAIAITVTNENDNDPVFTSPASVSVAENQTSAYTAMATDADGDALTYGLSGTDAALFTINGNTGVVSFRVAPDFEMPGDDNEDNDYNIIVTAFDGDNTTNHDVVITVTDENEIGNAPVFTSPDSASVEENQTLAYTAMAGDADGDTVRYRLSGADAARFTINETTGVVSFTEAPDFENPADAGGDNVYNIIVTATDDANDTSQAVAITVTNVNDNTPSFTSPDSVGVEENQAVDSVVYTAMATDRDEDPLTYSLSGTDAARFTIDPATGAVRFIASPDFENPDDAGGNNVYDITVTASDGDNSTNHDVAITVTNANDNDPIFTSDASVSVAENQSADTVVYTAMATDADGDDLSYSLSGADAARFTINPATGAVRFIASPDFENPADAGGNNVYDITVTATDGANDTPQAIAITVTNENDNDPVFTSPASVSVAENQTSAYTAVATDADGDALSYGLSGTDAALFTINGNTGAVSFRAAPDFEMPGDDNEDRDYNIIVTAFDGDNTTNHAVVITVTDVTEVGNAPVFTSPGSAGVEENQTTAYTAVATDADGTTPTYRLSGTDAALFTLDATTGVVSFREAPDFEAPGDAGGNNVYNITVTATDGANDTDQAIAITVTNVNDNTPSFTSPLAAGVLENQTLVYAAVATDADEDPLTYSLSGTDATLFTIDPNTGVVNFIAPPDFENPDDAGGDNVYNITVTASDGDNSANQAVAVTVTNENDNDPLFTSDTSVSVAENQPVDSVVYTATATDPDGDALTYSLSGTDAARFTIDPNTGAVRFIASPDFENPDDAGGNNVYNITVTASDGDNTTNHDVAITVTDEENEVGNAPVFTSPDSAGVLENQTLVYAAVATDADEDPLTYSLSGTDATLFTIDPNTGVVNFIAPPDFENPGDAGGDNVYDITVTASDGANEAERDVAVTVTNVNDNTPSFTSPATAGAAENQRSAYTAVATDADGDTLTYGLSGTDAALFTIDGSTGVVSFRAAPDFEMPGDANGDNDYSITVTAFDGDNRTNHAVVITVTDENEDGSAPVFTSPATAGAAENQTPAYTAMATDGDGDTVSYRLSGADAALFTIDATTGAVSFIAPPDFENPADAGGDNVYNIIVTATDDTNETTQAVAITVTNVNDNDPIFTSDASVSVAENQPVDSAVYTAMATDADGDALSYGLSGTDAARFTIDPNTGAVSFIASPDFESPDDAGGDNVYNITVTASDGDNTTTHDVAITVTDDEEAASAPVFTSPATATVAENQTAAYTAEATDADGSTPTYRLSGADAALFTLDATTGVVSFKEAPDFENPADAGGDNVYDITVTATDGVNETPQAVAITVTNINDNTPSFTSPLAASVLENQTLVYAAVATDADEDPLTYSLSGTDATLFTIDPNTGVVNFIAPPDFENPADAGGDNVYDITVTASDGANNTNHDVAVTVTNVNDNTPFFTSPATAGAAENQRSAYTAVATDADGDTLIYGLSGTDAALFTIDGSTGVVSFRAAPDFEMPGDDNGDNDYSIIVTAFDGDNTANHNVVITVTDETEVGNAPVFTSPNSAGAEESQTLAYTAMATDADGDTVSYRLSGADAALFTIDEATGVVSFMEAPDFESPADAGGDNVYDIIVTATDDTNETTQAVAITVTNVNDNDPIFTSDTSVSVAENQPVDSAVYTAMATDADGDALSYGLSGTDAARFTIDPNTGAVSFIASPDFESPDDAGGDNVYEITVTASDDSNETTHDVAITVTDDEEAASAPVFTSPATATVAENQTAAYTAEATDADGSTPTYRLSGADAALFTLDATTGVVSFREAPDFENPADAGGDNVYDIIITATDGVNETEQAVAVTVTGEDDNAPSFTSDATARVAENRRRSTRPRRRTCDG